MAPNNPQQSEFGTWVTIVICMVLFNSCISMCRSPQRSSPPPPASPEQYPCDYASGRDSLGRACGGRSAEVIPDGRLGGSGVYQDYQGRLRMYGACNDIFDDLTFCQEP